MKIALCNVQEFNPLIGGIERVSVSLASQLVKTGIDVIFISSRKSHYSEGYSLPAEQFTLPSSEDYSVDNVHAMAELLVSQKVDIVVNQNAHSANFHRQCAEVCKITNIRLVSVLHFNPDMRIKSYKHMVDSTFFTLAENLRYFLYGVALSWPFSLVTMHDQKKLYRALYEDSDRVILLSDKFYSLYKKIAGLKDVSKLCAIPNMLSFQYENEDYVKENVILWCGRMSAQKNPYRALYIWKEVQDKLPEWKLQMIGDGPWLERIKDLSGKMKLKRIEFLGFQPPKEYYKKAKIFMLTSNFEGWALTLTEAMQHKCVPVAFNSYESLSDIIANESCGLVVEPFNMKLYAQKIIELSQDKEIQKMANNAHGFIKRFSSEIISKQWVNLFTDLIKC